ncbi:unnamed protein product [Dracunculus medinensis]|uniref:Huntingtin n=1 Tax=Dracunculus medinensis TaxID=318479 RepID=A0A0N4UHB9_DRAME|nr:unnamed protein product [Dracunculus medinensis]
MKSIFMDSQLRKDLKFNSEMNRLMELLFYFIAHRNADLRLICEQTLDCILHFMIVEFNSSRAILILMSEIKRNGRARSLVAAIVRFADIIRYVKGNRIRAISIHFISALLSIIKRPEEMVQSVLERCIPTIFQFFSRESNVQVSDDARQLLQLALVNLELCGTANRAAVMIIWQLSVWFCDIRKMALQNFCKTLASAHDHDGRNILVGTLNSLRYLWPQFALSSDKDECKKYQCIIYNVLRCLYSRHNDVIIASLELFERIVSTSFPNVMNSQFFPQYFAATFLETEEYNAKISVSPQLRLQEVPSNISSVRTSPTDSLFGDSSNLKDLNDSFVEIYSDIESRNSEMANELNTEDEIIDPLRHDIDSTEIVSSDVKQNFLELSFSTSSPQSFVTSIPYSLTAEFSSNAVYEYASVLIARRFLLANQCFQLITDQDVRVSHKILAMACMSHLALYLPEFLEIPLNLRGGLGVQQLKDIQLFLTHEDDQLKAATITVIVNAAQSAFRYLGHRFIGL